MKSGIFDHSIPETAHISISDAHLGEPLWGAGHEQVTFCHDAQSGLRAIIAIYTTALGPALGGTRFYPYPNTSAALTDVLALSKAMAYKNALAGLDHGGGKAVIIGDPGRDKSESLLRAYGRFVSSLGGRYVTACDVGTYVRDMDEVAKETKFATGRSPENGGAGDSSQLTALGVFQGMRAGAEVRWGTSSLDGRLVGISGVGKVGRNLIPLLLQEGASIVVADPDLQAVAAVLAAHPHVRAVGDTPTLLSEPLDIYAPCALGGALTPEVVASLTAELICGGANNQLAAPEVADQLAARDVLYCPDFCVNAGGVIQVADEIHGFSLARATARTERIFETTLGVLAEAAATGVTPATAAERRAQRRMAEVSAIRRIHVG
jgi:valine dehydrogenase (NAD+)